MIGLRGHLVARPLQAECHLAECRFNFKLPQPGHHICFIGISHLLDWLRPQAKNLFRSSIYHPSDPRVQADWLICHYWSRQGTWLLQLSSYSVKSWLDPLVVHWVYSVLWSIGCLAWLIKSSSFILWLIKHLSPNWSMGFRLSHWSATGSLAAWLLQLLSYLVKMLLGFLFVWSSGLTQLLIPWLFGHLVKQVARFLDVQRVLLAS